MENSCVKEARAQEVYDRFVDLVVGANIHQLETPSIKEYFATNQQKILFANKKIKQNLSNLSNKTCQSSHLRT